jgi:hypothetical protein
MSLRVLVILAVGAAAGVALGIATSVGVGFLGGLGISTLLHTLVEPTFSDPPADRHRFTGAGRRDQRSNRQASRTRR